MDNSIIEWQPTPLAAWWATQPRRLGLTVSIGCVILMWLFGAFSPNATIFFLGAIGTLVGAVFLVALQILDLTAELVRCQKMILERLEKQS